MEKNEHTINTAANFLTASRLNSLMSGFQLVTNTLEKFHKSSVLLVVTSDSAELISKFVNMKPETMETVKKCIHHIGGAVFSTGIQVLSAHTNLTNPSEIARKMSFAPIPELKFKSSCYVIDLLP